MAQGTIRKGRVACAVAAAVLAISAATVPACMAPEAKGGQGEAPDDPTASLVRGAEPGGMTDAWEEPGGKRMLRLDEDGLAVWEDGEDATSGTWLMSSPETGEVMLSDGRTILLEFDAGSDSLSAAMYADGRKGDATVMGRAPSESDGGTKKGG